MQLHLANPHSKEGQAIDYEETRRLKERNNKLSEGINRGGEQRNFHYTL
jgi:hypothetical protein